MSTKIKPPCTLRVSRSCTGMSRTVKAGPCANCQRAAARAAVAAATPAATLLPAPIVAAAVRSPGHTGRARNGAAVPTDDPRRLPVMRDRNDAHERMIVAMLATSGAPAELIRWVIATHGAKAEHQTIWRDGHGRLQRTDIDHRPIDAQAAAVASALDFQLYGQRAEVDDDDQDDYDRLAAMYGDADEDRPETFGLSLVDTPDVAEPTDEDYAAAYAAADAAEALAGAQRIDEAALRSARERTGRHAARHGMAGGAAYGKASTVDEQPARPHMTADPSDIDEWAQFIAAVVKDAGQDDPYRPDWRWQSVGATFEVYDPETGERERVSTVGGYATARPDEVRALFLRGSDLPARDADGRRPTRQSDIEARRAGLRDRERQAAQAWARVHPSSLDTGAGPAPTSTVRTTPIVAAGPAVRTGKAADSAWWRATIVETLSMGVWDGDTLVRMNPRTSRSHMVRPGNADAIAAGYVPGEVPSLGGSKPRRRWNGTGGAMAGRTVTVRHDDGKVETFSVPPMARCAACASRGYDWRNGTRHYDGSKCAHLGGSAPTPVDNGRARVWPDIRPADVQGREWALVRWTGRRRSVGPFVVDSRAVATLADAVETGPAGWPWLKLDKPAGNGKVAHGAARGGRWRAGTPGTGRRPVPNVDGERTMKTLPPVTRRLVVRLAVWSTWETRDRFPVTPATSVARPARRFGTQHDDPGHDRAVCAATPRVTRYHSDGSPAEVTHSECPADPPAVVVGARPPAPVGEPHAARLARLEAETRAVVTRR